jgi:hypothetical protein
MRRRPQYRQFIYLLVPLCCTAAVFPTSPPMCHRRRESRSPKPTSPRVLARHRGRIRFLGSAVASPRLTSSSLYAGVRGSQLVVYFAYFCVIFSVDNPTVRMSLFALVFLLLLVLGSLSLSQIVVLVLHHTPMIHVVVLFLDIRINVYITKLLLFPTVFQFFKFGMAD